MHFMILMSFLFIFGREVTAAVGGKEEEEERKRSSTWRHEMPWKTLTF